MRIFDEFCSHKINYNKTTKLMESIFSDTSYTIEVPLKIRKGLETNMMNRACFSENANLHEQNQLASYIRPLKNNFVRMKILLLAALMAYLPLSLFSSKPANVRYTVVKTPWEVEIKDNNRQKARSDIQPTAPNHLL
jgi:hypothetical protein